MNDQFEFLKSVLKELASDQEYWLSLAKIYRSLYEGLVGAGFTEQQAFDLLVSIASHMNVNGQ